MHHGVGIQHHDVLVPRHAFTYGLDFAPVWADGLPILELTVMQPIVVAVSLSVPPVPPPQLWEGRIWLVVKLQHQASAYFCLYSISD